ncbi:MAG: GTP-binding protein [Pseudomonadales bacterium]|nr:GTP-binding protein [Pseudomonadales bacterium]MCP5183638.1 GTP-binding protein [Pseudomonadales bacterium]
MIAFTVLGGYLGAGKTTLLNHILSHCDGRRLGVLVNDFGAINIDASLVANRNGSRINLTNGCVCCTLSDGFSEAIETLLADPNPPEHILVEASGVADVRQLAQYGRAPGMSLDGIVVVVDARTLPAKVNDKYVGTTIRRQLAAGDLILLNKTDLIGDDACRDHLAWLQREYPLSRVLPCRNAELPVALLLGVGSTREPAAMSHGEHEHYATWSFTSEAAVTRTRLERFSQQLDPSVLRAKGTSAAATGPALLLQAVGTRREVSTIEHAPAGTYLVAIGLQDQLDTQVLDRLAADCFSPAESG